MKNFNRWFHFTGVNPEGDVFSNITLAENSALIASFTASLTDATSNVDQAKRMYLELLAPGTMRPLVLLHYA